MNDTPDRTWMSTHGWTTRERLEEFAAAVKGALDDLLESRPPGSDPAVEDFASIFRWWLKQLLDQR